VRESGGRAGIVVRFSILSALAFVALGLALAGALRAEVREHTLGEAAQSAQLIAQLGIEPRIEGASLAAALPPERARALDDQVGAGRRASDFVAARIWNRDGLLVYSDDRSQTGRRLDGGEEREELAAALAGAVQTEIDGREAEERGLIEVLVPLHSGTSGGAVGVLELYLPYAPIAAEIADASRTLALVVAVGLAALYALLLPIVAGASRRLRRQSAENRHQALHDALTGLPNRTLFFDRVRQAVRAAQRDGSKTAVMVLDLDRFKDVNDSLGHDHGDALLTQIAERLRGRFRASDTIARLGGDEFAILLPGLQDEAEALRVARELRADLSEPFQLPSLAIRAEASVGIALYPDHGDDAEQLLRRADVAMYAAKEARVGDRVYDSGQERHGPGHMQLLEELRGVIDDRGLEVHYQPQADLRSGHIKTVEALVRWPHPTRGMLPPDRFIALAEESGLIRPMTLLVLDTALAQCASWRAEGLEIGVAVNLSVLNLLDPQLIDDVAAALARHDLPARTLDLEITESAVMTDPKGAIDTLTRLRAMGVGLSLDDFGTGYSSLAYLKRLPVDEIKIDRSFVMNLVSNGDDEAIVRSTIDLGRHLGLRIVAEGVEDLDSWDELVQLGCDVAQGFYLARPMPPAEVTSWLRARGAGAPPGDRFAHV
jgi:diguanylate cyclase (GGDEF)-like protein